MARLGLVQVLCNSYRGRMNTEQSAMSRRRELSTVPPSLWFLQPFYPLLRDVRPALEGVIAPLVAKHSTDSLRASALTTYCPLYKETSLMGSESYTSLGPASIKARRLGNFRRRFCSSPLAVTGLHKGLHASIATAPNPHPVPDVNK